MRQVQGGFVHLRDIKSVLGVQIEYAKHDEPFCFRPEQGVQQQEGGDHNGYLCLSYILNIYNSVKHHVMGTEKGHDVLSGSHIWIRSPFVEFLQLYSENATLQLREKALIEYAGNAVPLNFSPHWGSWLIVNQHTVVSFLPFGRVGSLECSAGDNATSIHRFTSGSHAQVETLFTGFR